VLDSFRLGCMKIMVATQDQPFTAHHYYWVRNVFRVGRREKYSQPTAGFRHSDAALKEKLATFMFALTPVPGMRAGIERVVAIQP
jgi:hypothetical protein